MNIGEKFYCSRCLAELNEEGICSKCGYDPSDESDALALEEGTTLKDMRFHIGAVRKKLKCGYVYGAFDYLKQKTVYIFEYFPALGLERDIESGSCVIVPKNKEYDFKKGLKSMASCLSRRHSSFCENTTLYVFRL